MKRKYKLLIAYDGTHYKGWQIQPHADTVQARILRALNLITGEETTLLGAGRTDAGVHALGQAAHFTTTKTLDTYKLLQSLNGLIPHDIRILSAQEVPTDFHAQYSATGKIYHYNLWLERVMNPTRRLYVGWVKQPLDKSLLKAAAQEFIGVHDFSAFANSATEGSASRDAVRHITKLDVVEQEGGIRLEYEANGFLYKMVRNITGTLIEVALNKRPLSSIAHTLASKDRRLAGKAANPEGLFLMEVHYSARNCSL